jgi:N-acyl-D-aspartate/D-glutamate deacylase
MGVYRNAERSGAVDGEVIPAIRAHAAHVNARWVYDTPDKRLRVLTIYARVVAPNDLEETVAYDVIIRDGLWFDGTGSAPQTRSLGIRDGVVCVVSAAPLDETGCPDVIDAAGKWILPGFIDVHTHYDAEVLLDPGLRESVRHGVTTVLLGNCSLSTVYSDSDDAADLFSRVEAVPREYVVRALKTNKTWSTAAQYVQAIDALPLGPNVGSLLGHSDLRVAVLGLERATDETVRPTDAEMDRMAALLDEALDAGMLGMSGMDAAIDKLDGDRFRSRALPSTFATWRERRKLIKVLRKRGRILQSAPNVEKPESALLFFLSSSRMFGRRKGVRMSLLVSADTKATPLGVHVFGPGTRLLNYLLGASVRFQHLPVPFTLYSDGIDLPVFEEFGAGTAALHLRDQLERNTLLADKEYRREFRREFDRIKLGPSLWHRDFHDAVIVECPDNALIGKSFGTIADERGIHPLDAFLDVLVENGERNVRWTTVVANHRPKQLDKLAAEPTIHMGFSDAGAHLRNMAFYNFSLRLLKRTLDADRAGKPFLTVERAVHRLTGELGEWFGLDAGTLQEGDRADFVVIDPAGLDDSVDGYHEEKVPFYGGLSRMVNRNDAAVIATGVNGAVVFRNGQFREGYGQTVKSGRYLRAPAVEPQSVSASAQV